MWGFVSVMLAILFIFLPITPHTPLSAPVDRPAAYHSTSMPGALRDDALRISVMRDGNVFFRDHRTVRADLAKEIREGMRNGAEKRIYLVVDARAKYGDAISVLVQVRLAGIENVTFLTEKPYR